MPRAPPLSMAKARAGCGSARQIRRGGQLPAFPSGVVAAGQASALRVTRARGPDPTVMAELAAGWGRLGRLGIAGWRCGLTRGDIRWAWR